MKRLREELEEVKEKTETYDREREKILLRFPKNFSCKLDDMLEDMQKEYAEVMQVQDRLVKDRLNKIALNVEAVSKDVDSTLVCKNPRLLEYFAPSVMAGFACASEDIVELLVDDLVEELIDYMNEMENLEKDGRELIEVQIKKNRLRQRLAENHHLHAWGIIEKLEEYKNELCEDDY